VILTGSVERPAERLAENERNLFEVATASGFEGW